MTLISFGWTDPPSLVVFLEGGGVLVAIRNTLSCSLINPSRADLEQVFVRVRLQTGHVIVSALYLPPASQPLFYDNHVGFVIEIFQNFSNDGFCIFGDYNLPHADWPNVPCLMCSKKTRDFISGVNGH